MQIIRSTAAFLSVVCIVAICPVVRLIAASCDHWRYKFRPAGNGTELQQSGANFSQIQRRSFRTNFGSTDCAGACGRLYECRAFAFCPDPVECRSPRPDDGCGVGDCVLYSNAGPPFPSNACQLPVMRKLVARYESCIERWVGGRRFCLVQQRTSGNVSFRRSWVDYIDGFGNADNFWIGLQTFRALTPATVRFELTKFNGSQYHCEYDSFVIGDETSKYMLNYSRYAIERSNIGTDSLEERSRGMKFSTIDQDNDLFSTSCSNDWAGGAGWWFRGCFRANPNGEYSDTEIFQQSKYMSWYHIDGNFVSLREMRIMIQVDG